MISLSPYGNLGSALFFKELTAPYSFIVKEYAALYKIILLMYLATYY